MERISAVSKPPANKASDMDIPYSLEIVWPLETLPNELRDGATGGSRLLPARYYCPLCVRDDSEGGDEKEEPNTSSRLAWSLLAHVVRSERHAEAVIAKSNEGRLKGALLSFD